MLSRKNLSEKLRKMERKKRFFSIRKLSIGVASVLVGVSLYLNGNTVTQAATVNNNDSSSLQQDNLNKKTTSQEIDNLNQQEKSLEIKEETADDKKVEKNDVNGITISTPSIKIDNSYTATAEKHYEDRDAIYDIGTSNKKSTAIEVNEKSIPYTDQITLSYHTKIDTNSKEAQEWYTQSLAPSIKISLEGDYPQIVSPISSPKIISNLNGVNYTIGEISNYSNSYVMNFSKDNLKPFFEKATVISFDADLKFKVEGLNEIESNKVYYNADADNYLSKKTIDVKPLENELRAIIVNDGIKKEEIPLEETIKVQHQIQVKAGTYKYGIDKVNNIDNNDEAHNYTLISQVSADGSKLSLKQPIKQLEFGDISSLFGSNRIFVIRQSKTSKLANLSNNLTLSSLKPDFINILKTLSLEKSSPELRVNFSNGASVVNDIYSTGVEGKQIEIQSITNEQAEELVNYIHQNITTDNNYIYYTFTYDGPTLYPTDDSSYSLTPIQVDPNIVSLADIQAYLVKNSLTNDSLKKDVDNILGISYSPDNKTYYSIADTRIEYDNPELIYSDVKGTPAKVYIELIDQDNHDRIYDSLELTGVVGERVKIPETKKKDWLNLLSINNLEFGKNYILPNSILMTNKINHIEIYVHHKLKDVSDDPKYKSRTEKTVKRLVQYVDPITQKVIPIAQQTAILHRTATQNVTTGEVSYGNWVSDKTEFNAVSIPTFTGYTIVNSTDAGKITIDENTEESNIVTITYKPNRQVVKLNYIDKLTGETLNTTTLFGKTNEKSTYSTKSMIKNFIGKGYIVIEDETNGKNIIFDDSNANQEYNIYFSHKLVPIVESKSINQIIKYIDNNTSRQLLPDNIQTIKFTRKGEHDEVTNTDSWNDWVASDKKFTAVLTPKIKGYETHNTVISERTVDSNTEDKTIIVTFSKKAPIGIKPDKDNPSFKIIKRTITFSGVNRKPLIQSVKFSRLDSNGYIGYQDPITDVITYNNWYTNDIWNSYTPDIIKSNNIVYLPEVKSIDSKRVNSDSSDEQVEIKYVAQSNGPELITPVAPIGEIVEDVVKYVDFETGNILEKDIVKNITQEKFIYKDKIKNYLNKGWLLVSNNLPTLTESVAQEYEIVLIKPKVEAGFVDEPTIAHNISDVGQVENYSQPPVAIVINYIDNRTKEKLASDVIEGKLGSRLNYSNKIEKFKAQGYNVVKNDIPKFFNSQTSVYEVSLIKPIEQTNRLEKSSIQIEETPQKSEYPSISSTKNVLQQIDRSSEVNGSSKLSGRSSKSNSTIIWSNSKKVSKTLGKIEAIKAASKRKTTSINLTSSNSGIAHSSIKFTSDNYSTKIPVIVTFRGKVPDLSSDLLNKLPLNTKLNWDKKIPDVSEVGIEKVVVKVIYPDGTSKTIPVRINILKPEVKMVHTLPGVVPKPEDCIQNKEQYPKGTKYSWKKKPNLSKSGIHKAIVVITLPNKVKTEVSVSVFVEKSNYYSSHLTIVKKKSLIKNGKIIKPAALIKNKNKMPLKTKYLWKKKPNLKSSGIKEGIIKVVFSNGYKKELRIKVKISKFNNSKTKATVIEVDNKNSVEQGLKDQGESIRIIHNKAKTLSDIAAKEYVAKRIQKSQIKIPQTGSNN